MVTGEPPRGNDRNVYLVLNGAGSSDRLYFSKAFAKGGADVAAYMAPAWDGTPGEKLSWSASGVKFYGGGETPRVPQLTIHQLIAAVDGLPGKIPIHMADVGHNVPWAEDRHRQHADEKLIRAKYEPASFTTVERFKLMLTIHANQESTKFHPNPATMRRPMDQRQSQTGVQGGDRRCRTSACSVLSAHDWGSASAAGG